MEWSGGGGAGMAEDPNEILVFGYACKLFRDDDKAKWIDSERHLIPWMGDSSVKIDRYDGRGALMDFSSGSSRIGAEGQSCPLEGGGLDPVELERLLEEERYRDLREDSEFDDGNYQEVEFRKFQYDVNSGGNHYHHHDEGDSNFYSAVGYSYDQSPTSASLSTTAVAKPEEKSVDDDRPYIKPHDLMMPPNVIVPPTMKLHSIIEKTAKFIASHGNQMEIILKTKQSGNPLFNFLEYKDVLNPYFKYLVTAIRENSYTPTPEPPPTVNQSATKKESSAKENSDNDEDDDDDDDDGYLHPSLFRSSISDSSTSILPLSSYNFKANTENSAYSLLVSKIRGSSNPSGTSSPVPTTSNSAADDEDDSFNGYYNNNQEYFNSEYSDDPLYSNMDDGSNFQHAYCRPESEIPNPSDQLVIEKMSSYVIKNGPAFEELARTKGDPRFVFLNPSHEYHWYYLNCKARFSAESSAVVANQQFVSYSSSENNPSTMTTTNTEPNIVPKKIIPKSIPLSASGIPIANLESISNRPTTIPPEVASRIEMIRMKKNSLFAKKESSPPKIQFSSAIGKGLNIEQDENIATSSSSPMEHEDQQQLKEEESTTVNIANVSVITATTDKMCKSNDDEPVPEQTKEEAEQLRKQMRRQKAALFLQKISANKSSSSPVPEELSTNAEAVTETTTTNNNNNEEEEDDDDVESGEVLSNAENTPKSSDEDDDDDSISEVVILEENGAKLKADERLLLRSHSPSNNQDKNGTSRKRRERSHKRSRRSRSRSRSTSKSPTRSRSSYRRSLSHSSSSSISDSSRRKKRSKRKSSKKRKKKHDRDRSRSSSRSRNKKSRKYKR